MIVLMKIKKVLNEREQKVKAYELASDTLPEVGYFSMTLEDQAKLTGALLEQFRKGSK
jgi:hypothetical protein